MCAPYSSWLAIFLWLATAHVCFVSVGTLAFVFELDHLHVRMFQSRQCLGRCACALSRIMFVTMHDKAVGSALYCMSLQASSRAHVCVMSDATMLNMGAEWLLGNNQCHVPWENQARAKRARRF